MTTLIRKAFISNLDSADWMDTETKEAAKEKVRFNWHRKYLPEFQSCCLRMLETPFMRI